VSAATKLTSPASAAALEGRRRVLPGGVTAAARWDDPHPLVFTHARGQHLWDLDGHRYLDLHGGLGTALLGYAHPRVDGAVAQAMRDGLTFVGAAHTHEAALAERLVALFPEAERIAFCGGGGTDALAHAARIARAATGRRRLVKVEGGYQGWQSDLLANIGAPREPRAVGLPVPAPASVGMLPEVSAALLPVVANDVASLEARFAQDGDDIAAVFVEPVLHSGGCIPVDDAYLAAARELCDHHGALLVFDEVLSGFRSRVGGAAVPSGVVPDMAAYGKALANGHVIALLAGRADLLELLSPLGDAYFSGTFNAHPLGLAAANAVLDELEQTDALPRAITGATRITDGLNAAIADRGLHAVCQRHGSVFCLYLLTDAVRDADDLAATLVRGADALNGALRRHLREHGIFLQRRPATNRAFVSAAHTPEDIELALGAFTAFFDEHASELAR
jgi:glutamate-1-semialdehyde 2,1-aminomutase